jgi:hypothetical protein
MEDSKAEYLLADEDGGRAVVPWFDVPMQWLMAKLTGQKISDDPNRLVKTSERRSLYSARYFRYTVVLFLLYVFVGIGYFSGHVGFTPLDSVYFIVRIINVSIVFCYAVLYCIVFYCVAVIAIITDTHLCRIFADHFLLHSGLRRLPA